MSDKALFIIKIIFTLGLITSMCALAIGSADAMTLRIVQASGGLNVREAPTTEAKAVYLLDDCETVIVLEWRDGWALVAKNTTPHRAIGWVCGQYLK